MILGSFSRTVFTEVMAVVRIESMKYGSCLMLTKYFFNVKINIGPFSIRTIRLHFNKKLFKTTFVLIKGCWHIIIFIFNKWQN